MSSRRSIFQFGLGVMWLASVSISFGQCPEYKRSDWKHWVDQDRDCQNARHEVLIEESLEPVIFKDHNECQVLTGLWRGPYTGQLIKNASELDIDHLVPLKEAHESGGFMWSQEKKSQYANDLSYPEHLMATTARANRSKGAKDPAEWLPPDEQFQRAYAEAWVKVKRTWNLTADPAELQQLRLILGADALLPIEAEECAEPVNPFSAPFPVRRVECGTKTLCREMTSCEEAKAYLIQCDLTRLDRDRDGVPCEALCR